MKINLITAPILKYPNPNLSLIGKASASEEGAETFPCHSQESLVKMHPTTFYS